MRYTQAIGGDAGVARRALSLDPADWPAFRNQAHKGLRPNGAAGQFQIRVTTSLGGQVASASISQTNAEPAQGGVSSRTILILALVGGAAAAGAAVALGKGKSSTTTTPPTSGAVISPGTPSFGAP
jgi:hypothetical protein